MMRVTSPVHESSVVTAIGYDMETHVLRVYLNGKPYEYANVGHDKALRFLEARSPGRFYALNIRGNEAHPRVHAVERQAVDERSPRRIKPVVFLAPAI